MSMPSRALLGALLVVGACGKGKPPATSTAPKDSSVQQPTPGQGLVLPPKGQLYHGVLPAGRGQPDADINFDNLDAYERTVGRPTAYVYFTNNWFVTKQFPAVTAQAIRARGKVPFIRLSMRSQMQTTVTDPLYTLDNINAGMFDADLQAWADGAKAFATPLIVEYGTEINGDWYPWSAPYNGGLDVAPAKFRKAYRHIVQVMRARGATNILWAVHYAGQSFPEDPRNVPSAYWPGDDVVDWVGVSAYGSEKPYDHRCPTFASLIDAILPQIRQATQKPFFIFEFGITEGNPNCPPGPWIHDALQDLLGGRWDVKGFSWWNEKWSNDTNPADDSDMQVQDVPDIGNAFHDALTNTYKTNVVDHPLYQ